MSRPSESPERNVYWQEGRVTREAREALAGHRGACVWLTGLSASGKSTIAFTLAQQLHAQGVRTFVLDGDNLRHGLCRDLGFSAEDRAENIRRASAVAALMVEAGIVVIAAFISPRRSMRADARAAVLEGRFVECHVDCPVEVCAERDPKGLYARAMAGEIRNFTGIDAPYEPPETPELVLDTVSPGATPASCADAIRVVLEPMIKQPDA